MKHIIYECPDCNIFTVDDNVCRKCGKPLTEHFTIANEHFNGAFRIPVFDDITLYTDSPGLALTKNAFMEKRHILLQQIGITDNDASDPLRTVFLSFETPEGTTAYALLSGIVAYVFEH